MSSPPSHPPAPRAWVDDLPTVGLFGVLALGLGAWSGVGPALEAAAGADFIKGAWGAAFERKLDEEAPHRALALPLWGAIEYFGFGDGRDGVVIGENGVLFTDEELIGYKDEAAVEAAKLELILRVKAALAAKGVGLVVALLPAKVRIEEAALGRPWPEGPRGRYDRFLGMLAEHGVTAPDLRPALVGLEARGTPAFLRTDTHWTPAGAQATADLLAQSILAQRLLPAQGSAVYARAEGEEIVHEGDLLKYIPLGPLAARGPAPDRFAPPRFSLVSGGGGGGLLDEVSVPVALVGTSYSFNPLFGFAGALQVALGADVLNAAQEGLGPVSPMVRYLGDDALAQSPPQLVIWEIPERYIPRTDELATLPPALAPEVSAP